MQVGLQIINTAAAGNTHKVFYLANGDVPLARPIPEFISAVRVDAGVSNFFFHVAVLIVYVINGCKVYFILTQG